MSLPLRTSAARSAVVHTVGRGDDYSVTSCGRKITETWRGEMSDSDTRPVTCSRCLSTHNDDTRSLLLLSDDDARVTLALRDRPALFTIGECVGILSGLLSVSGAWVSDIGTVVRYSAPWGSVEYVVRNQRTGDEYVYTPGMLRSIGDQCARYRIPAGPDGFPVIGDPIWAESVGHPSGNLFHVIADDAARDRADRVRRGVCVDCNDDGVWDDGTHCTSCAIGLDMRDAARRERNRRADSDARERAYAEREAAMQRHPAGKDRPVSIRDTFSGYPNAVRPYNVGEGRPWALARDGRTIH